MTTRTGAPRPPSTHFTRTIVSPSLNPTLTILIIIISLSAIVVKGCFPVPYHRGKVETSVIKIDHKTLLDNEEYSSPKKAMRKNDSNVSITINFIMPPSSGAPANNPSHGHATANHVPITPLRRDDAVGGHRQPHHHDLGSPSGTPLQIDKDTQVRIFNVLQNLLYGKRKR